MNIDVSENLLGEVREIARAAGAAIMNVYNSDFAVQLKDDRSPLTEADKVAHNLIVTRLGHLQPALPVLSEEASDIDFAVRGRWQRYWLVDPLDGTKEFIKRNGEFTVNIALIASGKPVLGVVFAPVLDMDYSSSVRAGRRTPDHRQ
jgi:3'(2'), 5'-bisphosphate nucleotidase